MKKFVSLFLAVIFLFSFAACGNDGKVDSSGDSTEKTTVADPTVYNQSVFEKVKTFTEITGVNLLSTDTSDFNNTTYTYFVGDKADEYLYQYQEYLRGLGFLMQSTGDFKLEGVGVLGISTEDADSGKNIIIQIPCDKSTSEERKELAYKEMEKAFNNKEYSKVASMDYDYEYKDSEYYYDYSVGMLAWEEGVLSIAYDCFSQCSDKTDVSSYLNQIKKYTGHYRYKKDDLTNYYLFIENGVVGFETETNYSDDFMKLSNIDRNDYSDFIYFYPDPVQFMLYDLVVKTNDDGSVKMSIEKVDFINGKFERKFLGDFVDNKNGTFTINNSEFYNGEYTKISDEDPPSYN